MAPRTLPDRFSTASILPDAGTGCLANLSSNSHAGIYRFTDLDAYPCAGIHSRPDISADLYAGIPYNDASTIRFTAGMYSNSAGIESAR